VIQPPGAGDDHPLAIDHERMLGHGGDGAAAAGVALPIDAESGAVSCIRAPM
jgi:hypothetical protein